MRGAQNTDHWRITISPLSFTSRLEAHLSENVNLPNVPFWDTEGIRAVVTFDRDSPKMNSLFHRQKCMCRALTKLPDNT